MCFLEDGAPPHFATSARKWLDEHFPWKWIGRHGAIDWPPRSPDLTPLDFYVWSHLKQLVFASKPRTVGDLKAKILQGTITTTTKTTTPKVWWQKWWRVFIIVFICAYRTEVVTLSSWRIAIWMAKMRTALGLWFCANVLFTSSSHSKNCWVIECISNIFLSKIQVALISEILHLQPSWIHWKKP